MSIYNLSYEVTQDDLTVFAEYGSVKFTHHLTVTGRLRGFFCGNGYRCQTAAIDGLDGAGRDGALKVNKAAQDNRGSSFGGGGGGEQ